MTHTYYNLLAEFEQVHGDDEKLNHSSINST